MIYRSTRHHEEVVTLMIIVSVHTKPTAGDHPKPDRALTIPKMGVYSIREGIHPFSFSEPNLGGCCLNGLPI